MQQKWLWLSAAIVTAMAGVLWFAQHAQQDELARGPEIGAPSSSPRITQSATASTSSATPASIEPDSTSHPKAASTLVDLEDVGLEEEPVNGPIFKVDAQGNLVADERTRLNIEALVALTPPEELYKATLEATKDLPPAAAQRAEEVVDKFVHYQQAQKQSYPPGSEGPATPEEALAELDGLHALREAHFGVDTARAFYGREEKVSRELVELMRLENEPGLSMDERAERAQALYQRLPNVSAINAKNRADDEKRKSAQSNSEN